MKESTNPGSQDRAARSPGPEGRTLALPVILAVGLVPFFASMACSDSKALQRIMRPQQVREEDKSSLSIDQLEAAIADYATKSEAKKYAQAAELGLDASSNLGAYRIVLADRYMAKGMFKDAYDVLVLASKSYPDDWRIYYNAGMSAAYVAKSTDILGQAGAAERDRWLSIAESSYLRAILINPRSTQALYGAAVLYAFELGLPAKAAEFLVGLLGIETKNVDAMMLLARCYAELGRIEDAANWYQSAADTTVVPEKRKAAKENRAKLLGEPGGE
jgi:cytochrome c-type biogenesis protein CcmH/NrfG